MAWVSSGCGLTSTKVAWSAPAAAMAWLNRTGLRRLATQYSASKTGAAPVPSVVSVVVMIGMVGVLRRQIRKRRSATRAVSDRWCG